MDVNSRKKTGRAVNMWELNKSKKKSKDLLKFFRVNDNEDATQHNLQGVAEAALRSKCGAVSDHAKKERSPPF